MYLDTAGKCAKRVIKLSYNYDYPMSKVNLKENKMKQYQYIKKRFVDISDATCGMPEVIELFKLTNDQDYYFYYSKQLSEIPKNIMTPFSSFYDSNTKQ